ncbi:ABC transporter ATP-binding protein [Embleya sp. NPDC005575]|uniref:ABC transporter ATP-binding protein n=1 Tax=Embleya sp. NPDC005575 TaxID=3156892 RepID=UPI0033AFBCAA
MTALVTEQQPQKRSGAGRQAVAAFSLAVRAAPGTLALYAALALIVGLLPVVVAWLTKLVLDRLAAGADVGALTGLGVGLALAGLVTAVAPQVTRYLRAGIDREVGMVAQDRLFTAVEGFVGLSRFEDPRFLDRLRLAQQSGGTAPTLVVDGVLGMSRAALTVTGFLGSLILLSPMMTVLVLASGVPTLLAEIALSRRRARMFWDVGPVERRELFYGQLLSSVEAAKEVRLFGAGAFLRHRMLTERRTANAAKRAMDRREVVVQAGLGVLAALVSGGGLLWAVGAARTGALSVGGITMFVAAVGGVQGALAALAGEVARSHQAVLMFRHYATVTTAGPELPVPAAPRALPELRDAIELRDVWFRYSEEHPWVLRGVSLRIPHDQAVALVGLNGAGKSTLVKLLCRFYDPTRGAILWDGVDLRDTDPVELRRRIGAVFQDYMEYDLTAADNIALGGLGSSDNPDSLPDDRVPIQAAAKRAGIHHKLAGLPHGYDTLLSRMFFMESDKDNPATGVMLSGGQWQRLALARAFLRDEQGKRDLMILDEPSAGLDAEAEHEIHAELRRHRTGRTSLLISHRLGAVREADLIVVLSEGCVAERGDHAALMATGGEYARLFTLQANGYQDDPEAESVFTGGNR